jgi:hypothetical protein
MQFLTAGHFLAVGLGAAVGAWLRWMLAIWLNQPGSAMPWGTVVANLVGGYLIGLAFGFFSTLPALPTFWRLLGSQRSPRFRPRPSLSSKKAVLRWRLFIRGSA